MSIFCTMGTDGRNIGSICHASCANFKLYHGIVVSGLDHYHTPFFFPYLGRADFISIKLVA